MENSIDLKQPIIEALYCEALLLADEIRQVFDLTPIRDTGEAANRLRLALSVEGLRTTTRMMHLLAWLLNYRAYFSGELTEFQLQRHSKLPADRPAERENLDLLETPTRELIVESENLHARIARLDTALRNRIDTQPATILHLQKRLNAMAECH